MHIYHVANHHKHEDDRADASSTLGREAGWRAIGYWLSYGFHCKAYTIGQLFQSNARRSFLKHRLRFACDLTLCSLGVVLFGLLRPGDLVRLWLVPLVITHVTVGYFAWLTHAPAGSRHSVDGSLNTVNNWMGLLIFNQGYHQVHHKYPGIHWTEIPDRLQLMLEVDPRYITPNWVTINTAWRILRPERFRDREFGLRWQARYRDRARLGTVRHRWLRYFAWI
jgi:fatty acid desaturase